MGIFSTLRDIFSGRNLNQNTLLNTNLMRLVEKSDEPEIHQFVSDWVYASAISTQLLLETLFFEKFTIKDGKGQESDFNHFKRNIHLLDTAKAFEVFKLVAGHYLWVFLQNEENRAFVIELRLGVELFKKKVFSVYDYTVDDIDFYDYLSQIPNDNGTNYFITLYNAVFTKGFGIPREADGATFVAFTQLLAEHYKIFMQILQERKREFAEGG